MAVMIGVNGAQVNGIGPWRVEPDCPSATHNSLRAAFAHGGRGRKRCQCPHALDLREKEIARRREAERARMKRVHKRAKESLPTRIPPMEPEPTSLRSPNFVHGACAQPGGREIANLGMNTRTSHQGIADRARAKAQCELCPMLITCRAWVAGQEKPAGSWGGVWGGLDPWNRRGQEVIIEDGRAELIPYDIAA